MKLQLPRAWSIGSIVVTVLLSTLFTAGVCRGESWTSPDGRFSLDFPVKPEENKFKIPVGEVVDFRAVVHAGSNFANYSITIVETKYQPSKIISSDAQELIAMTHGQFVKTLNGDENTHKSKSSTFADGIYRLEYKFDFVREGEICTSLGFWFMDRNRIVRVSGGYPFSKKKAHHDSVERFVNSIKIIGDVHIPDDLGAYVRKIASSASLLPAKCTEDLVNAMKVGVEQKGGTSLGAWCFFSNEGMDAVRMSVEKAQEKVGPLFRRGDWKTHMPKGYRRVEMVGVTGSGLTWFIASASEPVVIAPSDAKTLVIVHGMK